MRLSILKTCTATAALLVALPALAQTAGQAAPSGAPSQNTPQAVIGLEEVIVTAQRRPESQQRAAVAVDVVSSGELANAGVVSATRLNAVVPALAVQQGGGSNTAYFIRGVGNFTLNGYSDPAVAFNLDGVYLGRPTSTSTTFFDLERIEVLKGPQGTLYGRNATGGAINVIPSLPRIGENSGSIAAGYGNYDAKEFEAVANLALGDKAALRVAGKIVDRDGYNDDGTLDDVGEAIRAQLLFEPTDALSVRVSADYSHQGGVGPGFSFTGAEVYTPGAPATATSPADYTFSRANLDARSGLLSPAGQAYFAGKVISGPLNHPAPLDYPSIDNHYWGVLAEINWKTDLGTLTILPAFRRSELDFSFNGPAFRGGLQDETDDQFSAEARFQGERVGPVDWLVGAYYFDEDVKAKYAFNLYQLESFQDFESLTKSYAAFGRVTININDRLRLVGGGRYTKDEKNFDVSTQTLLNICASPVGCIGGPSLPTVLTSSQIPGGPTIPFVPVPFGQVGNIIILAPTALKSAISKGSSTYRAAVEYDVAANSLLYASYETGYRSGGFSPASGHEIFEPEFVDALTVGSKNRFLNNNLQINVELFHWKYRDQQVSHFGLDSTGTPNFFTENIGRSTIQGLDLEAQFLATPTTRLSGNVQYIDSNVDSFTYNTPRGAGFNPPVTGCRVTPTTASGASVYAVNCSGKRGFNSPELSVNVGIEQTIPLDRYKVVLTGNARYRSNSVIGFDYLPQENSGDNTIFDGSVTFGDADDRWMIIGYVRNITDETVNGYTQFNDSSAGALLSQYSPPRTFGVRALYKF